MSSHHLLIDLEAEVRKTSKPESPPGQPAEQFPRGAVPHTHHTFDAYTWACCVEEAISDGEGSIPSNAEYWIDHLRLHGYVVLQLPTEGRDP